MLEKTQLEKIARESEAPPHSRLLDSTSKPD